MQLIEDTVVKTYSAKPSEIKKNWWITNGSFQIKQGIVLRGKHKTMYIPHMDLSGKKLIKNMENSLLIYWFSGWNQSNCWQDFTGKIS